MPLHRGTLARRWPLALLAGLAALSSAVALGMVVLVNGRSEPGLTTLIRVNQVGYVLGQEKTAYLMGEPGQQVDRAEVFDLDRGAVAAPATVLASAGAWNETYDAVYPIDFSDLDTEGLYRIRVRESDGHVVWSPEFAIDSAEVLYASLARSMTAFFQVQRDGADLVDTAVSRKPSHLSDQQAMVYEAPTFDSNLSLARSLEALGQTADLSGGWFDAGDYVKLTATTSYTLDVLLMAYRTAMERGQTWDELGDEIDFGLAWLEKTWDQETGVLYAQVGLGEGNEWVRGDHDVWRLPEEDDALALGRADDDDPNYYLKYRPVFPANEPGEPVSPNLAGRTAAAFAMAAQVHAATDPERARRELELGAAIYASAGAGWPETLVTAYPREYYPETSWADDMALAAVELTLAARELRDTRESEWTTDALWWTGRYLGSEDRDSLNLYDVGAIALLDLAMVSPDHLDALEAVESTLEDALDMAERDPFGSGAVYSERDSVARASGVVVEAMGYTWATGDDRYLSLALTQASWLLGGNSWGTTFVVGVGTVFPNCPQHQIANLQVGQSLDGAVVAGPSENPGDGYPGSEDLMTAMVACSNTRASGAEAVDVDGHGAVYRDDVRAWQNNEPTLDATATTLLAFGWLGLATELGGFG